MCTLRYELYTELPHCGCPNAIDPQELTEKETREILTSAELQPRKDGEITAIQLMS